MLEAEVLRAGNRKRLLEQLEAWHDLPVAPGTRRCRRSVPRTRICPSRGAWGAASDHVTDLASDQASGLDRGKLGAAARESIFVGAYIDPDQRVSSVPHQTNRYRLKAPQVSDLRGFRVASAGVTGLTR